MTPSHALPCISVFLRKENQNKVRDTEICQDWQSSKTRFSQCLITIKRTNSGWPLHSKCCHFSSICLVIMLGQGGRQAVSEELRSGIDYVFINLFPTHYLLSFDIEAIVTMHWNFLQDSRVFLLKMGPINPLSYSPCTCYVCWLVCCWYVLTDIPSVVLTLIVPSCCQISVNGKVLAHYLARNIYFTSVWQNMRKLCGRRSLCTICVWCAFHF